MAKVNRAGKVRRKRRWLLNVGDPIEITKVAGRKNPNDEPRVKKG